MRESRSIGKRDPVSPMESSGQGIRYHEVRFCVDPSPKKDRKWECLNLTGANHGLWLSLTRVAKMWVRNGVAAA